MTRDERAAGESSPASTGRARPGSSGKQTGQRWLARARNWGALAALLGATPAAAKLDHPAAWTQPRPPLHLLGSITYVGSAGLGAYLVRTPAGAILIDATMAENVPAIERNIRALGVRLRDVRYILVSHAHFDHVGGLERLRRDTGARVLVGRGDAAALQAGTPPGETDYGIVRFPAVGRVEAVDDGQRVTLGGVTLRAVATPGHTPGCMTWVMRTMARGRPVEVAFLGSVSVAGNRLVGNRRYPEIARDYRASLDRLARLHADVVLPMHPEAADVFGRAGAGTLVAPTLLATMVAQARADFERAWRDQSGTQRR